MNETVLEVFVDLISRHIFYFLITYGVCKKRKYCNRMSQKKNSPLLTNVHVLYVLEDKTSTKQYFLFLHTPYMMRK